MTELFTGRAADNEQPALRFTWPEGKKIGLWHDDHGILKQDMLFTPTNTTRTVHVKLPSDYACSDEKYPVMYFYDGHNLFRNEDATYGKSWGLTEFLAAWEKKIIVVGIECSHVGNDRLKEYCPYHVNNDFFGNLEGTGDATVKWIAEELKPVIDRDFRTWSHREATGIAGSSMGGLMSLYAVVAYNHVFSKAGCLSSAIGSCMSQLHEDIAGCSINPDTRIYLSWGSREGGSWSEDRHHELEDHLQYRGALTRLYKQPGGRHCEADWEKQVPLFMDFLWLDR